MDKVVALASGSMILLLLAGCTETYGAGPNSISRVGNNVRVGVCEGIDAYEVYGSVQYESGWKSFLDLTGSRRFEPGSVLVAESLSGLEGNFDPVDLEGSKGIAIKFEGVGKGASWTSTFGDGRPIVIPEDGWLQTDGRITDGPCA